MLRRWVLSAALLLAIVLALCGVRSAEAVGPIEESAIEQLGLVRAWFTQVQVDSTHGQVHDLLLDNGTLFVQTNEAMLMALDIKRGQVLWTQQVGDRSFPSTSATANERLVATVNGSTLFVFNRINGRLLLKKKLEGATEAGPVLADDRLFVPTVQGKVFSFRVRPMLDPFKELGMRPEGTDAKKRGKSAAAKEKAAKEKTAAKDKGKGKSAKESSDTEGLVEGVEPPAPTAEAIAAKQAAALETMSLQEEQPFPLVCQSPGRVYFPPTITRQSVHETYIAWPTDNNFLCVGTINRLDEDKFVIKYQVDVKSHMMSPCTYVPSDSGKRGQPGTILTSTQEGYVHALSERDGEHLWKFCAGGPVSDAPVAIRKRLYVTNTLGGLHCLDAKTGERLWWTPEVVHFVAQGKERLYGTNTSGQLLVLHAKTGVRLAAIETEPYPIKMTNSENDRIFLAAKTGLVQCLHEVELSEPLLYREKAHEEEETKVADSKPVEEHVAPGPHAGSGGKKREPKEKTAKPTKTSKKKGGDEGGEAPAKPTKRTKKGAAGNN